MFFDTKIERFIVDESVDPEKVKEDFDTIDGYKEHVSQYIYTNIRIAPEKDMETAIQARVQAFLSQSILRSLYLKDEMVHALNANNFPGFYALAKSFLEIPAQLGYLTFILYEDKPEKELQEALHKLMFAHKGGLTAEAGVDPINVLTMFDKLDTVLQKIEASQLSDPEEIKRIKAEKPMRTMYEDVCNFGHPNFAAHLSVGGINKEGLWVAKTPKKLESYKHELYGGFYMNHFTMGIGTIYITTSMIERHSRVDHFSKLSNRHLEL